MTQRQFNSEYLTLNWDSAHRLTQAYNDAYTKVENYRYDAHGHRVRTVRGAETVYQVYSQAGDLLMERTNTGKTTKYARIGGRLIGESVNGIRRAIQTDVIGSVRQKTDAFGTLVYESVRAPYGSTLLGWQYQNGPAFTGHMEDGGTGLTYMKARYYDPVAMRFLSPDPVYVDLTTGGNFNRYWYANNNPYTNWDPDGRCTARTGTRICSGAPGGEMTIGFRGMRVGSGGGDNATFVPFVEDRLGGKVYAHGPRGRSQAVEDVVSFKEKNPEGLVHLLGYSRGGRAAIQVANELRERGIDVATVTTFDPHDLNDSVIPLAPGAANDAQNYFQSNPQTSVFGLNPFLGRPVAIGGIWVGGQNYTGDLSVNHLNIVWEALERNSDAILGQ